MDAAMKKYQYLSPDNSSTCFVKTDDKVRLERLFGLNCGFLGRKEGPARASGMIALSAGLGVVNPDQLKLKETLFGDEQVKFAWRTEDDMLHLQSDWSYSKPAGIWSRMDTLTNSSEREITVFRCLARFPFSPGRYEIYSQSSHWCNENQGRWQTLNHGSLVLSCEGGRTTQGGTPYLCIRESSSGAAVVFHIIPKGNWVIRISAGTAGGDSPSFAVVELGLSDQQLALRLSPGQSIALPRILIQHAPEGEPHLAAPKLHSFLLQHHFCNDKRAAPIVYNTWFDDFEFLAVPRLRRQLKTAKEIGCEVFVIDAGWYGGAAGSWSEQTGDWREKEDAAFRGRMIDFAAEVRAAGLGFGLWVEPERLCYSVPIRLEHPDWFLPGSNNQFYPDLSRDDVARYILSEMVRLIDMYKLVWLKIDFNFELCVDPTGAEFFYYYERWYGILDELRGKYPRVFFEGCASGGMRHDVNTASHFDGHFLSDNVNPWDALTINHSALLRLPPGRVIKWTVLRSVGNTIPRYGTPLDQGEPRLVTPAGSGATWDSSETTDLDFAARVGLPGIFGFSGDIAGLPVESQQRMRKHTDFFKKWRRFIAGSVAHLLNPPQLKGDRSGWLAVQLQNPRQHDTLVFVYRLEDPADNKYFCLKDLNRKGQYQVENSDEPEKQPQVFSGEELMNGRLTVKLPGKNTASIFVISHR